MADSDVIAYVRCVFGVQVGVSGVWVCFFAYLDGFSCFGTFIDVFGAFRTLVLALETTRGDRYSRRHVYGD